MNDNIIKNEMQHLLDDFKSNKEDLEIITNLSTKNIIAINKRIDSLYYILIGYFTFNILLIFAIIKIFIPS